MCSGASPAEDYILGLTKDEYDVEAVELHSLRRSP